jgi:hypothetical protein
MRVRSTILLTWGGLLVGLWAATFWSARWLIAHMQAPAGTAQLEQAVQALRLAEGQRTDELRRCARLLSSDTALRAALGGDGGSATTELTSQLTEASTALNASCVFVLDDQARVIGQSANSPWQSPTQLAAFLASSPQAGALVRDVLGPPPREAWGLWSGHRHVYHAVGAPVALGAGERGATGRRAAVIAATRLDPAALAGVEVTTRFDAGALPPAIAATGAVLACAGLGALRRRGAQPPVHNRPALRYCAAADRPDGVARRSRNAA